MKKLEPTINKILLSDSAWPAFGREAEYFPSFFCLSGGQKFHSIDPQQDIKKYSIYFIFALTNSLLWCILLMNHDERLSEGYRPEVIPLFLFIL